MSMPARMRESASMAAMAAAPPAEWPAIAMPGRVDQPGARPGRVRTGQLVEHEADIRCPACRYLLLPVPPGCLTGEAGGDPPVGKGRGVTLVRVVNPGHHVAVAGQVLGQGGERAAGVGEAGREHDEGAAALPPGRPGVTDRVGLNPAQRVRREAGDAPAGELELGLRWRHVPGSPPVRRHRRIPQGNHQLPCVHPRDPRIGTGGVCQPHGSGADRVRTGRLRKVRRGTAPRSARHRRRRKFPCRPLSPPTVALMKWPDRCALS